MFALSSCKKGDERGKMIPGNALFAVVINTDKLSDKLSWEEVKQTSWYKKIYANSSTDDWIKKVMDSPGSTGIDSKAGIVFFVTKADNQYNMVFEGKLKDAKAFEAFNKNLDPSNSVETAGDLSTLIIKGKSVAGWNDDHFAYVTTNASFAGKLPRPLDSLNKANTPNMVVNPATIINTCKSLFNLKSDSSLAKNERFNKLLKEDGDVHGWMNTEEIANSTGGLGMLSMFKLDFFFKGNVSTYTLNFRDGKIDLQQHGYAGKEFTDFLKKYKGDNLDTDLFSFIPSQNVIGAGSFRFKPEGLRELLRMTGMDGMINTFTSQMGFTIDDFVNAQSGELLVAVTDLDLTQDSVATPEGDPGFKMKPKADGNVLLVVGLNNKTSFQKLLNAGKQMGPGFGPVDGKIAFNMNEKYFVLGNKHAAVNQFLSGKKNSFDLIDKIKGHPMGAFIDLQKLFTAFSNAVPNDTNALRVFEASKRLWSNIVVTGGEMDGDAAVGHYEVNLVDKNTNSLKQLNKYFEELSMYMPVRDGHFNFPAGATMMLPDTLTQ